MPFLKERVLLLFKIRIRTHLRPGKPLYTEMNFTHVTINTKIGSRFF